MFRQLAAIAFVLLAARLPLLKASVATGPSRS